MLLHLCKTFLELLFPNVPSVGLSAQEEISLLAFPSYLIFDPHQHYPFWSPTWTTTVDSEWLQWLKHQLHLVRGQRLAPFKDTQPGILEQQSPAFLAPGTSFVEGSFFFTDGREEGCFGMIWAHSIIVYFTSNLMPPLIRRDQHQSMAWKLGTPLLEAFLTEEVTDCLQQKQYLCKYME